MKASTNSQVPGILYYGKKQVSEPDTFRNIAALQKQLMEIGYKKSLFEKHYYNGNHNTYTQNNSTDSTAINGSKGNKEYNEYSSEAKKLVSERSEVMSLQQYILTDFKNSNWFDKYISTMGDEAFWTYKRKLYLMLYQLEVGKSIEVTKWCKPETIDLFLKIASCFVQESRCNYQFNNTFTIITHKDNDAREMDNTLALLRQKRRDAQAGADGNGTTSGPGGTEVVFAP